MVVFPGVASQVMTDSYGGSAEQGSRGQCNTEA